MSVRTKSKSDLVIWKGLGDADGKPSMNPILGGAVLRPAQNWLCRLIRAAGEPAPQRTSLTIDSPFATLVSLVSAFGLIGELACPIVKERVSVNSSSSGDHDRRGDWIGRVRAAPVLVRTPA
jgi:hypothetical protein